MICKMHPQWSCFCLLQDAQRQNSRGQWKMGRRGIIILALGLCSRCERLSNPSTVGNLCSGYCTKQTQHLYSWTRCIIVAKRSLNWGTKFRDQGLTKSTHLSFASFALQTGNSLVTLESWLRRVQQEDRPERSPQNDLDARPFSSPVSRDKIIGHVTRAPTQQITSIFDIFGGWLHGWWAGTRSPSIGWWPAIPPWFALVCLQPYLMPMEMLLCFYGNLL